MAKLCVEGNRGFEALCRELDIPYKKTGKLLVAFDETDMDALRGIMQQGIRNGCEGLRLVGPKEMEKLAPGIGGIGGMYSPETAVFDPFLYCIALAENALTNGATFHFNSEVVAIERGTVGEHNEEHDKDHSKEQSDDWFVVKTADGGEHACRTKWQRIFCLCRSIRLRAKVSEG